MTKPITYALGMLQGGALNIDAGETLAKVIKAVEETGKPGKLVLTLDITRVGAALAVVGRVTDKTPEEKPLPDMYWSTPEGHLTLRNPAQKELPLQAVPETKGPIERVDQDTGEIRQVAG